MKLLLIISVIVAAICIPLYYIFNQSNTMQNQDIKKMMDENPGVVIDVRTLEEHEVGHLAITDKLLDVLNNDFQETFPTLDKSKTYYLYCRTGNRSGQAAQMMKHSGFENVHNIGGFDELVRAGFKPAEK
jgi:phage shock protein E